MHPDAFILSRIQFAFVISFHILFPALTIGLASYLAVLEGLWLATRRAVFKTLYLFWLKIFALSFGMGVVSGVVMSYQFGTNWSVFSRVAGSVVGPLMAFEVLSAFFLEASFLGVMLFGWRKVGPGLHFTATCMVALGTLTSAFWIMSANSWMQSPAGYAVDAAGRFVAVDWLKVVFNPTFPARFVHMVLAAYLSTALVVASAAGIALQRGRGVAESRVALRMAVGMIALVAPLQLVAGHLVGENVRALQPLKLAAIEAYWRSGPAQPLNLIGWPDRAAATTRWAISIPRLGNLVEGVPPATVIRGLDAWPRSDWPIVPITFWSFRIMVGLGLAMIGLGLSGLWLWARRRLDGARLFRWSAIAMGPTGFVSILCGWATAEVGRQPWAVYGLLRTRDAASPVAPGLVATSLAAFVAVYAIVFAAGSLYILRLVFEGPRAADQEGDDPRPRAPGSPLAAAPVARGAAP